MVYLLGLCGSQGHLPNIARHERGCVTYLTCPRCGKTVREVGLEDHPEFGEELRRGGLRSPAYVRGRWYARDAGGFDHLVQDCDLANARERIRRANAA